MTIGYEFFGGVDPESQKVIEEILDADIAEISAVDVPATARPFRMFKRARAHGGVKVEREKALEFARFLAEKVTPADRDPAEFERCVENVMNRIESGEIVPQDPDQDPKSVGFAICTASGAGAGKGSAMGGGVAVKDDGAPPAPAFSAGGDGTEAPAEGQLETIEIPATPEAVGFSELIQMAMDSGFSEDEAIAVAQIIRKDFGDPEDAKSILVPDGSTPEGMIASAAIHGGIAVPAGLSPQKGLKFTGESYWQRLVRKFLGKERPKPPSESLRLRREVWRMQAKTKEDLKEIIARNDARFEQMIGVLGAALGVKIPVPVQAAAPEGGAAEAGDAAPVGAAAPAAIAEPASSPAPTIGDPTKQKCTPTEKAERTDAEKLALLRELLFDEVPAGDPATSPAPDSSPGQGLRFPDSAMDDDIPGLIVPDPGTAPNMGDPEPEPALAGAGKAAPPTPAALRKSADPGRTNGGRAGQRYSTMFNRWVDADERRQAGWKRGV